MAAMAKGDAFLCRPLFSPSLSQFSPTHSLPTLTNLSLCVVAASFAGPAVFLIQCSAKLDLIFGFCWLNPSYVLGFRVMFVGCSQCELIWVNCSAAFVVLCLFCFGCKETLPKGWLFLFWLFVYPQSLQCLMIDWVCAFVFGCDCKGSLTGKFRRFPNFSHYPDLLFLLIALTNWGSYGYFVVSNLLC